MQEIENIKYVFANLGINSAFLQHIKMEKGVLEQIEPEAGRAAERKSIIIDFFRGIASTVGGKRARRLEKRWDFSADGAITSLTSAIAGGKNIAVFTTKNGKLYVLSENAEVKFVYNPEEKLTEEELFFAEENTARNIYTTPAIADINNDGKDEIIFGTDTGKVYALDLSGKLLWSYKAQDSVRSSAMIEDINNDKKMKIVFGSNDGNLYALNSKGKLLWKFKANSGIEARPSLLRGKKQSQIIFGSNDGIIYSVDGKGKALWQFKTDGKITAAASTGKLYNDGEDYIVIGSFDSNIYALNANGKLKWKYKTEGNIFSEASLADINNDKKLEIIFGCCDDNIYALSCSGDRIWNYETDFWVVASPLAVDIDNDGKLEIVAGSYDRSLYILDAEGTFLLNYMPGISSITQQSGYYDEPMTSQPGVFYGKKLWSYKTDGMVVGIACMANKEKNIITGTDTGKISSFILK